MSIAGLDCLLVSPSTVCRDSGNMWKEINSNFPPLGLASLAGYVREKGFSVKIIDGNIQCPFEEDFHHFFKENFCDKFSDIKLIGFTTITCTIKKAFKMAKMCRQLYPNALIVFGGVHATFMTDEVINNECVDVVVKGEGELTMHDLLSGKALSDIPGICYKKQDKVFMTKPRERIIDLDALPMPAYDLLPIGQYRPAKGSYKRLPAMSMMTSRGCPGRCTFCSKTLGNKLFFKSAKQIVKELEYLIAHYKIKEILFYDDTFTVNKKNVMEFCDLIIQKNIDVTWTCFARVDFITLEMLKKMKRAGCHQVMYGVENIDEEVRKNIKKHINVEQVVHATQWTKQVGIECRLAFMIGNPGDTKEIILKNIEFINKLDPDILVVNITTPFPGTEMFAWAKAKGLILTYDWDDYTLAKPVMRLENLTEQEIHSLYNLMYKRFYLRPRFILKKALSIRNINDLGILLGGFKAVLSFLGGSKKCIKAADKEVISS
ncbi:MAG: radical SAM protein [Pseudomonadota bacterium]